MTPRVWTCRRTTDGIRCKTVNPRKYHICRGCGKRRSPTRKKPHMAALELSYEFYIDLNGGEHCGICGYEPKPFDRRLDRDHEHRGDGRPRGLLCHMCNRRLDDRVSSEWLRAAADYLERYA